MRSPTGARRAEVRLTPGLVVLVVLLGLVAGLRPAVASPTVTGMLWAGLATVVAVGVVLPLLDRRSRRLAVARCATDVVEGSAFGVTLSLDRAGFPLQVQLDTSVGSLGPACPAGPAGASSDGTDPPSDGLLVGAGVTGARAVAVRRGVYTVLPVQVTDTGPFGLLRVRRVVGLRLPAPLFVAPRALPSDAAVDRAGTGNWPGGRAGVVVAGDTVRSVRRYVPGDPSHLVHWPSSAHAGELMVMELEPPAVRQLVVVVDLRGIGAEWPCEPVEDAVRLAAGAVQRGLDESMRVVLCTAQPDGPDTTEVHGIAAMRRLLAAAVPGRPGPVPEGCVPVVFTPAASEAPGDLSEPVPPTRADVPTPGPRTGARHR